MNQTGDLNVADEFRRSVEIGSGEEIRTLLLRLNGSLEPTLSTGFGVHLKLVDVSLELFAVSALMCPQVRPLIQSNSSRSWDVGGINDFTVFIEDKLLVIGIVRS